MVVISRQSQELRRSFEKLMLQIDVAREIAGELDKAAKKQFPARTLPGLAESYYLQ